MSAQITITSSHGFQVGDPVTMPMRLTVWQRFLIWVGSPTRWPPKTATKEFAVSAVSSGTSADLDFICDSIE